MQFASSLLPLLALAAAAQQPGAAAAPDGAALYARHCATCHDKEIAARRPSRQDLAAMSAEAVVKATTQGTMQHMSGQLTDAEKAAIATFVTGKPLGGGDAKPAAASACATPAAALGDPLAGPRWNGWGADPQNTRFQGADAARLTAQQVPRLALKWAFAFKGTNRAYGQPTVAGGRVFVGSANGSVYALDARTGCVAWEYKAGTDVRTAISIGPWTKSTPPRHAAYFGDGKASVSAVDAQSGELLWKSPPLDSHAAARITGAPLLHGGRLYVPVSSHEEVLAGRGQYACCSFRGSVVALDALTGQQLWKTHSIADEPKPTRTNTAGTQMLGPAGGAIWTTPTLDAKRGLLYVGTGNAYTDPAPATTDAVLAIDLKTGALAWSRQPQAGDHWNFSCATDKVNCAQPGGPDFDIGSSPILRELPGGRRVLVVGQKSGMVYGMDPDAQGKILWETRVGQGSALGGVEWGPAADAANAYVANSDVIGENRDAAGGLFALKLATGEKVWHAPPKPECNDGAKRGCSGAQSAAVTVIPGVVFSGGIDGHIRAFATGDGALVWDFNTVRQYETVNGEKGEGGSLDAAGPTVVDGVLYVNSGYGQFRGLPGNVLLAFSVDGK
jgi:polyvinyl alcohol dehydrogenase (cytochrome)